MSDDLVEALEVSKTYTRGSVRVLALEGVTVRVRRGELVCVMGPPGAGKSTLLHLLGLLEEPSAGRLILRGRDVSRLDERERAGLRLGSVGLVFQFFNLLKELSALENVMLPRLLRGEDPGQAAESAQRLLDRVGLAARARHRPGELSGGQQQRVAIARALANEPNLVLADEPTGNLDSKTSASIRQLLGELTEDGDRSVVVVTHEKEWAGIAHRVVQLRDGRLVSECEAAPLMAGPA